MGLHKGLGFSPDGSLQVVDNVFSEQACRQFVPEKAAKLHYCTDFGRCRTGKSYMRYEPAK